MLDAFCLGVGLLVRLKIPLRGKSAIYIIANHSEVTLPSVLSHQMTLTKVRKEVFLFSFLLQEAAAPG